MKRSCFSLIEIEMPTGRCVYFRYVTWCLDICIRCEVITTIKQVNVSSTSHSEHMCVCLCVCMCALGTRKTYPLSQFAVYSSVLLAPVTPLCVRSLELTLLHDWALIPLGPPLPIPPFSQPLELLFHCVSRSLPVWDFTYQWDRPALALLCPPYVTLHNVLPVPPGCRRWPHFLWYSIHYQGIVALHSRKYHIFFMHSSVDRHLRCSHILALVDNAAMSAGVQLSLCDLDVTYCGHRLWSGIAGSHGSQGCFLFNCLRKLHLVFHNGYTNLHSHR